MIDPRTNQGLWESDGSIVYEQFPETVIEIRSPPYLCPNELDIRIDVTAQERRRDIFVVPV